MPSLSRRRNHSDAGAWPGWVDVLSSLVMVVIFLLMIFVVAQFYLATALTGRDEQLQRLNQKVTELNDLLALERDANADLRLNIAQISHELQNATAAREDISARLGDVQDERDRLTGQISALTRRANELATRADQSAQDLEEAYKAIAADRETIELRLREIASLQNDLRALREARTKLEGELAALSTLAEAQRQATAETETKRAELAESLRLTEEERRLLQAELGTLRDRSRELESRIADADERTVLAQKEIDRKDIRIAELTAALDTTQTALTGEQELTTQSRLQVSLLNQQIAALRDQIARLNAVLEASEKKAEEQRVQIADLGARLNQALASKVQELARYRSEFFGRLREALGNRQDVRIVGDRFVFQSEVLFPTGSATLQDSGRQRLAELATTLKGIADKIPPDISWVLRVDGHTDLRPINTYQFPSNWELSTARAISVVRFLAEQGIPPERLAAAGFGEFQPLGPGTTEDSFARNRRIELKLDQR